MVQVCWASKGVWVVARVQLYVFPRAEPEGRHTTALGLQIPYTLEAHVTCSCIAPPTSLMLHPLSGFSEKRVWQDGNIILSMGLGTYLTIYSMTLPSNFAVTCRAGMMHIYTHTHTYTLSLSHTHTYTHCFTLAEGNCAYTSTPKFILREKERERERGMINQHIHLVQSSLAIYDCRVKEQQHTLRNIEKPPKK